MNRFLNDTWRIFVLMGVVGTYLILSDPANAVVFQSLAIGIFLVGGTHLTRRILFNHLDLQYIVMTAVKDNNLAAAIVVFSLVIFLVAVMFLSMQVFR